MINIKLYGKPSTASLNPYSTRIPDETKNDSNLPASEEPQFQFTDNLVSPCTPVLYSTNRGLYLRTRKGWRTAGSSQETKKNYNFQFCDLERWSSNRAYTVSLSEDIEHALPNANTRNRSVRFVMEHGGESSNSTISISQQNSR